MKKLLLVDIDGVVLDWFESFRIFLVAKGISINGKEPLNWSMKSWVDHNDIAGLILEFNNSEAFGEIPPMTGAIETLKEISREREVVAITSCGLTNRDLRVGNLNALFGAEFFKEIFTLDLGESKENYLNRYEPSFWIDDNSKNAQCGADLGHNSILFHALHNRAFRHPKVTRLFDWYEIFNFLKRHD